MRNQSVSKNNQFFRSRLERDVAEDLVIRGVDYEYETSRLKFVSTRTYIPDFLLPNGIFIEVKGWFKPSDRAKHLKIKEQNPGVDVRFVFQRASQRLSRQSKTSYGQWCDRYGFKWAERKIPQGWIDEPAPQLSEARQQLKLFKA